MTSDPDTLTRIAAARTVLDALGDVDALLKQIGGNGGGPAIVFRSGDGQRRISAGRIATWNPSGTVEIIYLDGYTTDDEPIRSALIELTFLSSSCGVRTFNMLNGKLQIPSAAGWMTVG